MCAGDGGTNHWTTREICFFLVLERLVHTRVLVDSEGAVLVAVENAVLDSPSVIGPVVSHHVSHPRAWRGKEKRWKKR